MCVCVCVCDFILFYLFIYLFCMCRASIPFQQVHQLVNPWNDNKKVQISRDGQVGGGKVVNLKVAVIQPNPENGGC